MGKAGWDAIVVGAGAFGLCAAFALVQAGRRVLVLDQAAPGAGASGGPVGALAPHPPDAWSAKKALQRDALVGAERWWRGVAEAGGGDPGYRRTGRVMPLRTAGERARAERRAEAASLHWPQAFGWRVLEPGEAARWLAAEACPAGAVRETMTARLAPRRALSALVRAIEAGGGSVRSRAMAVAAGRGGVRLADGTRLSADAVVIAAGTGSAMLLAPHLGDVVHGVKGQALRLRAGAPDPAPVVADEGLWIVPQTDGTVAVGSTSEESWESEAPDARLEALLARARALCPWLERSAVLEGWAGIRPRAVGPEPLVGAVAPGLVVATAGFKTGWALAPVVAGFAARAAMGEAVALPAGLVAPQAVAEAPKYSGEWQAWREME